MIDLSLSSFKKNVHIHVLILACILFVFSSITAQESSGYRMPPKEIADLVDAPTTPAVSIGPNQQWMLLMERPNLPPISVLAQPELRLAGMRINPGSISRSRLRYYNKLTLKSILDGTEKLIVNLPSNPQMQHASWAPDGKHIAFTITHDKGVELWVVNTKTGVAKQLTEARVNATFPSNLSNNPYRWVSDSQTLLCKLVPNNRGEPPAKPMIPDGPVIQQNMGKNAPARTYQDL